MVDQTAVLVMFFRGEAILDYVGDENTILGYSSSMQEEQWGRGPYYTAGLGFLATDERDGDLKEQTIIHR